MASVYTNDLRLEEIGSGEQSGTWGDTTNTNLELIAEAFAFGTEAITTNADTHATTIADGATDPGRALFLKYTGTLDSACTITLGPNTVSKMWFIQNSTSGSQNIIISQGSGANVTIPAGQTKSVYSDGAGSGAAIVDAFATLNVVDLLVDDDLTVTDDATVGGTLGVTGIATFTDDIVIGDGKTIGSASDVDAMTIASNGQVTFTQTLIGTALDISGDIDVDGTTNLDAVDIDGAVNMATTALVTGVLTTTAATVFNGGFAANDGSTITTNDNSDNLTLTSTDADASAGPNLNLYRNSASPADGDFLGNIKFNGRNDNSQDVQYAEIEVYAMDVSDGAEDGLYNLNVMTSGTNRSYMQVRGEIGQVVFNEDSQDIDFRVESNDNANMLSIDGALNQVAIGTSDFNTDGVRSLLVIGGSNHAIHLGSASADGASGGGFFTSAQKDDKSTGWTTLGFWDNGSSRQVYYGGGNWGPQEATVHAFYTGGYDAGSGGASERMNIDSSGSFQLSPASNQGTFRFGNQQGDGSGIGAQFYLDSSQSIWYNSTTSTADKYHAQFINGNGLVGHIKTNGSATAYNTSSDYRLKTDAQPMTGASDRVLALKPVNFEWIADGTRVDGFLAHEAQAVVPEAVTGTKDAMKDEEYEVTPAVLDDDGNVTTEAVMGTRSVPDMQGIDQSKLVPLLTAALQEALARITALEAG